MAIIFQHELDRLNGILFTYLITDNKKIMNYEHYLKYAEEQRAKIKNKLLKYILEIFLMVC